MAEKVEKKVDKDEAKKESKETSKKTSPQKKIEKITKGIKRIAGQDVSGDYRLEKALLRIRGIGKSLNKAIAKLVSKKLGIPENIQVGDLNDEQIEQIDKIVTTLHEQGLPEFMLNRRKDILDGSSKHLIMNDLLFANKQDVEREKNMYSWKGYRHAYGQKVRGQRTRNTGRMGMTVGVLRKAVLAQTKAASGTGTPSAAQTAKSAKK